MADPAAVLPLPADADVLAGTEPAVSLRRPLVEGDRTPGDVTDDVCRPLEGRPTGLWWAGMFAALSALALGIVAVG